MRFSFYACIDGNDHRADVMLVNIGGDLLLQVSHRVGGLRATRERCTQPRYLSGDVLARVLAGIRVDDRMPSWMLADVLQECGIPADMCECIRASELNGLGMGNCPVFRE